MISIPATVHLYKNVVNIANIWVKNNDKNAWHIPHIR